MELADVLEKCVKLLPWLQDYILFWEGGGPGSGKGEKATDPPEVAFSSLLSLLPRL